MPEWNAAQYLKFAAERTLPSLDLADKIPPKGVQKVLDVGCGPGNSSAVLAQRFSGADILGVDNAPDMLRTARAQHPAICFKELDISGDLSALGGGYDVVFSNAVLQWVPGHAQLLPRLLSLLRAGGVLAVQVPMNQKEPIYQILESLAGNEDWKGYFTSLRVFYTLAEGDYFDILAEHAADFRLWNTTYFHTLTSHEDILEWYRATGLRPYLEALPPDKAAEFEQQLLQQLQAAYPVQKNGSIIFRFPRFFFTATAK